METLGGRVLKEDLGHWVITIPNFCHSLFRLCAFMWAATTLHFCCYRQLFYHAFAACVGLRFSGSKMKQSFFSSLDCSYRVLSLCIGKVKEIQIDKVSEWYSALSRLPFGTTSSPNTERVISFSGGGGSSSETFRATDSIISLFWGLNDKGRCGRMWEKFHVSVHFITSVTEHPTRNSWREGAL